MRQSPQKGGEKGVALFSLVWDQDWSLVTLVSLSCPFGLALWCLVKIKTAVMDLRPGLMQPIFDQGWLGWLPWRF